MIHYLVKTTEEYWQPNLDSVEAFHKALQEDGEKQGYQVSAFSYTEKPVKEGGEVIDSFFITKVTKLFDDAKSPEKAPMRGMGVSYDFVDSDSMAAHTFDDMSTIEDEAPFEGEVVF